MRIAEHDSRPLRANIAFALCFWVCCSLLATPAAAQLPEEPPPQTEHRDEKLGLVFPVVANFLREAAHQYPDPKLGYSVHYEFALPDDVNPTPATPQGTKVTFFVYDLGRKEIAAGAESAEVQAAVADAVKAIHEAKARGSYRAVEEDPALVVRVGDPATGPQFRRVNFRITGKDGRDLVSSLYVTGYANHFIKVRATMPKRQAAEGEKEVARLLAAFAASMKAAAANPAP